MSRLRVRLSVIIRDDKKQIAYYTLMIKTDFEPLSESTPTRN